MKLAMIVDSFVDLLKSGKLVLYNKLPADFTMPAKQNKFALLVNQVYEAPYATIFLMRHLDDSTDISDFGLHLTGENLSRSLALLNSICSNWQILN